MKTFSYHKQKMSNYPSFDSSLPSGDKFVFWGFFFTNVPLDQGSKANVYKGTRVHW